MEDDEHAIGRRPGHGDRPRGDGRAIRLIRHIPIAWRFPLVVALNAVIALVIGLLGWHGAYLVAGNIDQLTAVQEHGRRLAEVDAQASRLQSLTRQYLNAPTDEVMKEISRRTEDLYSALVGVAQTGGDGDEMRHLAQAARRFVAGFQQLKSINADITRTYETEIVQTAGEMSGLYTILNSSVVTMRSSPLAQALAQSHEDFIGAVLAINTFYFSGDPLHTDQVHMALGKVAKSVPDMRHLAASNLQRDTLTEIGRRTARMDEGVEAIARAFDDRARVLSGEVDANQAIMASAIDRMMVRERGAEASLRQQSRDFLRRSAAAGLALALALLAFGVLASLLIGQSIRAPLSRLRKTMEAGARGDWSHEIDEGGPADELAAMAGTVAVFRGNALDKQRLEAAAAQSRAQDEQAKRQTLSELLTQMEAHEYGAPFSRLVVGGTDGDAAEIAAAFNRVLDKFQHAAAERAAAIDLLTQAKETAEADNLRKSSFLASMTHELRAPLNGVMRLVADLGRLSPTEAQHQVLNVIHDTGLALLALVDDILDFSRLEAGRLVLDRAPVHLPGLVEGALATLRPLAAEKGLRLTSFVDPMVPTMMAGDGQRLRQILVNLVDNAIKFTPAGHVAVFVQAGASHNGRRRLRLIVADSGLGIGPDNLSTLFQPFTQAERDSQRRFGGTGLGLSITQRLTQAMGGGLEVDSRTEAGSTFVATVMLDELTTDGADNDDEAADLMGLRLLVLSPDASLRGLIARLTEQSGAAVVRVANAQSARAASLRAVDTQAPFDLAVVSAEGFGAAEALQLRPTPFLVIGEPALSLGLERLHQCRGLLSSEVTETLVQAIATAARPAAIQEAARPAAIQEAARPEATKV